ncbi:MAG TPA: hypothetical protein VF092_22725 [Longimicrobium sp.]
MLRRLAAALAMALALPAAAAAQDPDFRDVGTDSASVFAFVRRLNAAVRARDSAAVARMVHYPADVWTGRCYATVLGPQQLLARYGGTFSPGMARELAAIRRDSIFVADDAVGLNGGLVWIAAVGPRGALRIITLNRPTDQQGDVPECPFRAPPLAPGASVTGTWEMRMGPSAGCSLEVEQLPRSRIHFLLDCSRGGPSYNVGSAEDTIPISRGVAVYRSDEFGRCEIRFTFFDGWMRARHEEEGGGCGFGHNVYASGTYRHTRTARPRFEPANGR